MGAWGPGIFSDDNAADLRDDYRALIGDGLSGPEATDRLLREWAPEGDPALAPVFWLALAVTQWNCGRLEERVKQRALQVISDGSALLPWRGSTDERKRKAALDAAKSRLESLQPAIKKIAKQKIAVCEWKRGDLIGLRLPAGDYVVFRMLHVHRDKGGAYPVMELLDWRGELEAAESIPEFTPARPFQKYGKGTFVEILGPGKRRLKDRIVPLRARHDLPDDPSWRQRGFVRAVRVFLWRDIDRHMTEDFGL
ncbi:MAG TPA: hypothetical protein VGP62_13450 [Bryobacteraceae bacterium]|jgi:hypothetical protein|nr:hypothetical protein [Bryobacteraceae bacterium]